MILNRSALLLCVLCLAFITACSDKDTDPPPDPPPAEEEKRLAAGWEVSKITETVVYDVQFVDARTGFFVADSVYKTIDSGKTWTRFKSPKLPNYVGLSYCHFLDASSAWVTQGRGNLVFFSTDGCQNWSQASVTGAVEISQIKFLTAHTGFVIAQNGLFRTNNGGYFWEKIYEASSCSSFFGLDDKTFWAGVRGGIIRTTDGKNFGKTEVGTMFLALQFFDKMNGLALESTGQLYHTTDGGINWQPKLKVDVGGQANDFHFFDKDNGYVSGDNGVAKISGNQISMVVKEKDGRLWEMFFTDPQHGYVGSARGNLYRYTAPN